jgi:hypothetical protein
MHDMEAYDSMIDTWKLAIA